MKFEVPFSTATFGSSDGASSAHADAPTPHPATVADPRVPGITPDPLALLPWMDVDPQTANLQATTSAALLEANASNLEDPRARYAFIETLERIANPQVRALALEKFAHQTGHSVQDVIQHSRWAGKRDEEQALALISPRRDAAEQQLASMPPVERERIMAAAIERASRLIASTNKHDIGDAEAHAIWADNKDRSPAETEALRIAVQQLTRGKESTYETINRGLSGGN